MNIRGLTEAEAAARLKADGPNELPRSEHRTPVRIVLEVVREPMLTLLLGGGAIYLALGDVKEAIILVVFHPFDPDYRDPGDPYRACPGSVA